MWTIAVDAMGGDNAPKAIIEGTLKALQDNENIKVKLFGIKDVILQHIDKVPERLEIIDAPEVIETGEDPLIAIRKKQKSSLIQGLLSVKAKESDAFISAGSTGAVMAGALFRVGRIKGIDRPALAPVLPTEKDKAMLIDCGANADCEEKFLLQFALMGSAYMELVEGVKSPKVGLLNIGAEEEKGNKLYKKAHQSLKEMNGIDFYGNVEGRDALSGSVDVIVCDGFTGNIFLKTVEGIAGFLFKTIKREITATPLRKLGALILKSSFKDVKETMDYKEYGGAPLLGIEGCVIKAHGSSDSRSFECAINQGVKYLDQGVTQSIKDKILSQKE